jgi:polynucleotide 5'-hydroxyl-kinase GRC3/NOL9
LIRVVRAGKTLLVNGPASATILKGSVEVLGAFPALNERLVVRKGLSLPLYCHKDSTIELVLGKGSKVREVLGDSTPMSWRRVADDIKLRKPRLTIIIGDINSGKTTFCVFLSNKALTMVDRVVIIDGDVGQADIGASGTIGMGVVQKPIMDLFSVPATSLYFIGATSPSLAGDSIIAGLKHMVNKASADFILLNTDGWVRGSHALQYKLDIVGALNPDAIVFIKRGDELNTMISACRQRTLTVYEATASTHARKRGGCERKLHRESSYKKFLRGARVRPLRMDKIGMRGNLFGVGRPISLESARDYERIAKRKVIYGEEGESMLLLVIKGDITKNAISDLRTEANRDLLVLDKWPGGFYVGLSNGQELLGLGILTSISYDKGILKVQTPVAVENVRRVELSQMRLSPEGKELS